MTKIFTFGGKVIFLSCLVNLCLCDRIVVQKKSQGNRNYSDILVTKHNYYTNYLRRTTPKPSVQSDQSFSWELVSINDNEKNPEENPQIHRGNFTDDFYSFNCTMLAKPTTKLIPLRQRNPTSSPTRRTPLSPLTTSTKPPVSSTRSSKRKKVIYVNPPIISAVETVLDSAYDMVEDALTTKKRIRVTTESSIVKKRTKKSPNGSKLITTQVHVTNEYEPITQSTVLTSSSDRIRGSKEESSEEYYEDDLLYYEDYYGSDEESSVESPPPKAKPQKVLVKPIQVKISDQNILLYDKAWKKSQGGNIMVRSGKPYKSFQIFCELFRKV